MFFEPSPFLLIFQAILIIRSVLFRNSLDMVWGILDDLFGMFGGVICTTCWGLLGFICVYVLLRLGRFLGGVWVVFG